MVNGFHFCTFFVFVLPLLYNIWHAKKVKKKFQIENKRAVKKEECRPIVSRDPIWNQYWKRDVLSQLFGSFGEPKSWPKIAVKISIVCSLSIVNTAFNYSLNWAWKWEIKRRSWTGERVSDFSWFPTSKVKQESKENPRSYSKQNSINHQQQ
jgi:hypothetical protein